MNTVDHNNTTGNDRKVCAYYDELHNLFHKDATIAPVALCSNRRGQTYKQPVSDSTTDAEEMHLDEEIPKKKKKVQTLLGELVSLFLEFTKSREESEKQKNVKTRRNAYWKNERDGQISLGIRKICGEGIMCVKVVFLA